jgi:membrane protease YdiL (CAAX protease family)
MSVIRNDTGEIRLIWRLLLIILLYVAAAVLLRLIPISIYTVVLVKDGMALGNALNKANAIIQGPVWFAAIGILSALIGLLIVWFLVRVIEKSSFIWKTVGLDWRRNSLLVIMLGTILALFILVASILARYMLGSNDSSLNVLVNGLSIPIFFQNILLYLAMGFGEEIIFRGYIQTRLVERYSAIWGILITAIVFVLLHQISYSLSPILILSGVMLWTTVGILYHWSKSLYLVIIFHGLMNALFNTLDFDFGDIGGLIVHAFVLSLVIVFALIRSRSSGIRRNSK